MSKPLPRPERSERAAGSGDQPDRESVPESPRLRVVPPSSATDESVANPEAELNAVWPEIEASVRYLRDR